MVRADEFEREAKGLKALRAKHAEAEAAFRKAQAALDEPASLSATLSTTPELVEEELHMDSDDLIATHVAAKIMTMAIEMAAPPRRPSLMARVFKKEEPKVMKLSADKLEKRKAEMARKMADISKREQLVHNLEKEIETRAAALQAAKVTHGGPRPLACSHTPPVAPFPHCTLTRPISLHFSRAYRQHWRPSPRTSRPTTNNL